MTHLAANLKYLMSLDDGLGQTALAKAAGVNQSTISRILNPSGTAPIVDTGAVNVMKLADYFGVSIDDMMRRDLRADGVPQDSQPETLDEGTLSSALVTVKEAMRAEGIPLEDIWRMAAVLIYAYEFRSTYPATMSKAQYHMFDESVRTKLRGHLADGRQEDGNAVATRARSNG